ncbi:MAG: hypothetical protein U0517_02515 [Candidatus Andersenbacteria bacterium]
MKYLENLLESERFEWVLFWAMLALDLTCFALFAIEPTLLSSFAALAGAMFLARQLHYVVSQEPFRRKLSALRLGLERAFALEHEARIRHEPERPVPTRAQIVQEEEEWRHRQQCSFFRTSA